MPYRSSLLVVVLAATHASSLEFGSIRDPFQKQDFSCSLEGASGKFHELNRIRAQVVFH